ncbi:MAG: DnaJ domain-containing protein [Alphaproteobacteria bacterium]
MNPFVALLLLLLLALLGLYVFVNVKPATLVRALRAFTTTFAALAGTGLLLMGRFGLALIAFIAAIMAIRAMRGSVIGGWTGGAGGGFGTAGGGEATAGPAGKTSDIATDMLAMQLDHRTGDLDGDVLQGRFAGRSLASLGLADLMALLIDCQRDDPRAVPLLETYLDRHHPTWRDQVGGGGHAQGEGGPSGADGSAMDVATACRILDLSPDATADEIKAAHRRLMNKLHPDHGGSSYFAAQLNQAKDVLLGR